MKPKERKPPRPPSEVLDAFAAENPRCWLCGLMARNTWPPRLQIHHVARGPDREAAREERSCLIMACPPCHADRLDGMPVVTQLAIKKLFDPKGYDRVKVNVIRSAHNLRGPQPEAITEDDVMVEARWIQQNIDELGTGHPFPRKNWSD